MTFKKKAETPSAVEPIADIDEAVPPHRPATFKASRVWWDKLQGVDKREFHDQREYEIEVDLVHQVIYLASRTSPLRIVVPLSRAVEVRV